jgi:hypothetical protein
MAVGANDVALARLLTDSRLSGTTNERRHGRDLYRRVAMIEFHDVRRELPIAVGARNRA